MRRLISVLCIIINCGNAFQDGFFDGELIDGRRGLVPSNFIEKVADEDLPEFHAAMAMLGHHDDDSTTVNSMQHDLDFDSSEEMEKQEDIKIGEYFKYSKNPKS